MRSPGWRVVLLGGSGANWTPLPDCWEWDGSQWTPRGNLPAGSWAVACDDGASLLITSGNDLWRANGTAWTALWRDPRPDLHNAALVYDPVRRETMLTGASPASRTWTWNGRWQQRGAAGLPPRASPAIAPLGNDMVLFGGADPTWSPGYAVFDETWHWNGNAWSMANPANRPPPRYGHAMVNTGNHVLLFGGLGVLGELDDTWRYDGTNWTRLQPPVSPPARLDHVLAFDPLRQRTLLFGGGTRNWAPLQDTWEWDGATWIPFATTGQPYGGRWPLAFDGTAVVMLQSNETWAWSGNDWLSAPSPANSLASGGRFVFDTARQRLVFRADSESLHVIGPTPAGATTSPLACGNQPDLRLLGRAAIGTTSAVHVEAAPNTAAIAVFGLQLQQQVFTPACHRLVSLDATVFGLLGANGQLDVPLVLPANPTLRGMNLHAQAIVLDGGPVFGGSLSGALHLQIGD